MTTTPIPAYANERRKYNGKINSAANAAITVAPLKTIVRPAVDTARRTA